MTDDTIISTAAGAAGAADDFARRWTAPPGGAIRPGNDQHKLAFCRMLLDTHNPYKPAVIDWPRLDEAARERLLSLPIWDIAVQTEGKARIRVLSYAETIADPLLREAITLNAFEEGRHKQVLSSLVAAYGIPLEAEPEYRRPRHPKWAFMVTGVSECIDSFFAFGLFALAQRSAFFPPDLVETFEPIMQEEARHILFFVNWMAWYRRSLPRWRLPWFWCTLAAVWFRLIRERIGLARGVGAARDERPQDNNFTLTGSKAVSDMTLSAAAMLDLCLAENQRRMAGYDARLLRPQVIPRLVGLVRRFLRDPPAAAAIPQ
ncbi:MAG TPA: ferritin-like domain-containing protein [Stellaceae bacterium]|nr:ferritin-like domain-containing protein [Stellaceae bacterium]